MGGGREEKRSRWFGGWKLKQKIPFGNCLSCRNMSRRNDRNGNKRRNMATIVVDVVTLVLFNEISNLLVSRGIA